MSLQKIPDTVAERDMPVHQRGLVDTSFEESQYESGIAVLDQLRSPKYRPSAAHIQQLLYIALYPPPPAADDDDDFKNDFGSPSKLVARQQRKSLGPSSAASDAAYNLLMAFAYTNSPKALLRALPSYSTAMDAGAGGVNGYDQDDDSFIAREAVRIKNAKCCWEILKDGFVQRNTGEPTTPKAKSKRQRKVLDDDDYSFASVNTSGETASAVGETAWPVLDWLLTIFERDETLTEFGGEPLHSPLLLSQIPPSRANTARWDIETPMDIALLSLQETASKRKLLGVRLLTMLINLTSTTLIDLPMFLNTFSRRVSSLSLDNLSSLFAMLPPTYAVLQFKLMLCKSLLGGPSASGPASGAGSRPQARAQPRPIPARRRQPVPSQTEAPVANGSASTPACSGSDPSIARKYAQISLLEIVELLTTPRRPEKRMAAQDLKMKAELLLAFGTLRGQKWPANQDQGPDAEWQSMVQDGKLKQALETAFGDHDDMDPDVRQSAQSMKGLLLATLSLWQSAK